METRAPRPTHPMFMQQTDRTTYVLRQRMKRETTFFVDSVTVTSIAAINNPPNAVTDTINVAYSETFAVSPLNNDSDPDADQFSILSFGTPVVGTAVSINATKINYTAPYGYCGLDSFTYIICDDGNPVLCDTGTVLIFVDSCVTQSIAMSLGWNIISGYVIPLDLDIINIFSAIVSDLVIVKNAVGDAYIPTFGINAIGDWVIEEGLKVKTLNATTLDLSGPVVNPTTTPISLLPGWSQIAYLRTSPMDAIVALSGIASDIIIIKDISGDSYIPSFGINGIGDLLPGQGYKVKMSNAAILTYSDN